ncbi:DUF6518 family protein [Kineosporia babensis]|uniref:DUF6518 family protein n=1 Tax=Kineosporia babensis TaxID=499548 RepID=A0A9X1N8Q9_9ACTN|nr:DUF6518 family protein [Kineosporia babensis]
MSESLTRQSSPRHGNFGITAYTCILVSVLSLVLGALTAWAQKVLPYELFSFANSANGWLLLMVALLVWVRAEVRLAAVLGSVSGVLLMLGYTAGRTLYYGETYDPWLWTLAAALAGPFIGVATAWLRAGGIRAALGTAALAGVTIGEAIYGVRYVGESTSPVYWVLSGVAGVAFLVGMMLLRLPSWRAALIAVVATAAVIVVFIPVYGTVGTYA